jgi:predicted house-cleaning NTP pyrophosphatase (Maf/HAM1 superfamily)
VRLRLETAGLDCDLNTALALSTLREGDPLVLFPFTVVDERLPRDAYWASGEPRGKAGAYAIQGRAAVFIQHIRGSYSGVMGLPLFETAQLLKRFGLLQ